MDHEKGSKKGIKLKEVTIKRLKRIIESGVIVPNEVGKILNLRDNTVTISSEIFPRGAIILDIIPPNGANLRKINSWYIFTDEYGGILGYTSEKALAIYKQGRTVPDPWTLDNSDNIAYPDANIVDITRGKMLEIYTSCGKPFDIGHRILLFQFF